MKNIHMAWVVLSISAVFSVQAAVSEHSSVNDVSATLWVGAAASDITPAEGTYLAGYGKNRVSTGSSDPLSVKAVAIESSDTLVLLFTIDSIGLTRPDVLRIEQGIREKLPAANVVVSSTHTHAGADVVGIWGSALWRSGRDEAYLDRLVSLAVDTGVAAYSARQAVTSRVASMGVALPWVKNLSEPELLDTQLSVLQFLSLQGETVATLTNYACHPTILGPDNTLASADFVQGFYTHMTQSLAGEHLFLQGSIGGWVQPLQGDRSFELALQLGRELAARSLEVLATSQVNVQVPLIFKSQTFDVPLDNWGFRLLIWLGVLERELFDGAMRTSMAWFRIGDAQFVTHPGETSPAYSLASRELLDTQHVFVMGLTQDAMGYILKPDYFADGATYPHAEYLTSVSVGEQAGPQIMQVLKEILR